MSWLSTSRALDRSGSIRYATDSIRRPDGTTLKGMLGQRVSGVRRAAGGLGGVTAGGGGMASNATVGVDNSEALAQSAAEAAAKKKKKEDLMMQYGEESMDLQAEERAAKKAAKLAVTARMDSEARRIGDMHESYLRRGLFAGDGAAAKGLARKVKVSADPNALEELKNQAYITEKRKLLTQKYANAVNPGRAAAQLSRGLLTPRAA